MKMYRISSYGFTITEEEITRKSESSVWYMWNGKERRNSGTYYFDTWDDARNALIKRETLSVQRAEQQLTHAKAELKKAETVREFNF
jgi:hypothetical protein